MNFASHSRPTEQRRSGARQTADHDILRCRPFQKHGVDKGITYKAGNS